MLFSMFAATAAKFPSRAAIVEPDCELTYLQLETLASAIASTLQKQSITAGDRVILLLPNCAQFVAATFAISKLGAVIVPLNLAYKADELLFYFEDAQAKAVVTFGSAASVIEDVTSRLSTPCMLINLDDINLLTANESLPISKAVDPSATALYQYSTGSTGKPKRVMRSFGDLVSEAENFRNTAKTTEDDKILAVAPFFHAHGFGNGVLAAAASGASLVTLTSFTRRKAVMSVLKKHAITIFPGVPFMFSILAEAPSIDREPLPALRLAFSAGAALDEETYQRFLQKYGVPIRQLYGSTETGAMCLNTGATTGDLWRSVGRPLHNVSIEIAGEDGMLGPNENGEIVVRSNAMTSGYANLAEATKESFRGDQFWTGDLGYLDEGGHLFITGRKKFFINAAGNKVDPAEIENLIAEHPKVKEVVVVGVESSYGLEVIKAVVVLKEPCNEQDIRDCCLGRVADFKVPRIVEFRTEIPKSPLGKVLRKYLIEQPA
jgi:Acyl-CoA synthetases (AMP-forming)/AMP-acid ligases II